MLLRLWVILTTKQTRSDGNDNSDDVDYLKNKYQGDNFFVSETNDTIMDLCLMTKCDHNIVSHDSTFSWWAAYLNQNPDKIVVAPNHYHPDMPQYTHRNGFYPESWTLV